MTEFHDDILSDLFAAAASGAEPAAPVTPPAHFVPVVERALHERCPKCGGSGKFIGRNGLAIGKCFTCGGSGRKTFKTAPDKRAKARAGRVERKAADREAFAAEHKAEIAWLNATTDRQHENAHKGRNVWDFPIKLVEALAKYGSLTDGQVAAVRKCMARDAERATAKAADTRDVDVSKIEAAFATATANAAKGGDRVKRLGLRLDTFRFSPAARHPGVIYVKEGEQYLGKITGGKFFAVRNATEDQKSRIVAAATDPAAAAIAYGQRFKHCAVCSRELTDPVSRERGIGPVCADRFGF